jgi:peptidyl-prolyl cis-trans isomerase C
MGSGADAPAAAGPMIKSTVRVIVGGALPAQLALPINSQHWMSLVKLPAYLVLLASLVVGAACSRSAAETQGGPPGAAEAPKPMPAELPEVLARVNDEPVTKADFERLIRNIEGGRGPIPAERRDEVLRSALDQLITYTVMKQEAAARNITVTDADIEAELRQMQQQFPDEAEFAKALAARNTSLDQLRADARVDMQIDRMLEAEVASAAEATEADAREFYDGNPDQFEEGESVRASHILVMAREDADEATRQQARAKIEAALKRARAGEDFAALAREYSDDGSKEQGGDLGFFERGRMVPPFEQAAFELQPGQLSDIVATQFGFHIIKVSERKEAGAVPYEQVKPQIVSYLSNRKKQERVEALIEDARKRARIEVLV